VGGQQPKVSEQTKKEWEHLANKENWRITQLTSGMTLQGVKRSKVLKKQLMEASITLIKS
jgi:hypothetical protein